MLKNKKFVISVGVGVICLSVLVTAMISLRRSAINEIAAEETTEVLAEVEETEAVEETVSFVDDYLGEDVLVDKFMIFANTSLYEEPSFLSDVLFDLVEGEEGMLLSYTMDSDSNFMYWHRVSVRGTEGYIASESIVFAGEIDDDSDVELELALAEEALESMTAIVVVTAETENAAIPVTTEAQVTVSETTPSTKSSSSSQSVSATTGGGDVVTPSTEAATQPVGEDLDPPISTDVADVTFPALPFKGVVDMENSSVGKATGITDEERALLATVVFE